MNRTTFRNIWIAIVIVLLISAMFVLNKGQKLQEQVERANAKRERLERDFRAGNQLSAALAKLDNLTINENQATRLDILRHLELEKSDLDFRISSKIERREGGGSLFARQFTLSGDLPYEYVLARMDWLNTTQKAEIRELGMRVGEGYGDSVSFKIEGMIYGLEK